MAKKDAIFDYAAAFDTGPYLTEIGTNWTSNTSNVKNVRMDAHWRGDPSDVSIAVRAGWEAGKFKCLDLYDIAIDAVPGGSFQSMSHNLLYDLKVAFNLPNQYNKATWDDNYTRDVGESHTLWWRAANTPAEPMKMSDQSTGSILNGGGDNNAIKCSLHIPISGFTYYGVNDNTASYTVWPTSTNMSTMNTHYTSLEDADTAAASWSNPTKVGSEFTQSSDLCLVNYQNYWQQSPTPTQDTNALMLCISYTTHTYAQIKALMDAAIA